MGKTFLIGQLERYGDCLFATTLAKQIKNDYPDSHLTWAIFDKYKSVLDLNPYVDEVWEIYPESDDLYGSVWDDFESAASKRGFDEVIFSQISPRNWIKYTGTIRGTILSAYEKPITVSVEPIIRLSENEVETVRRFAEKNELSKFKNVILFECSPGSEQSNVNLEFAMQVAENITRLRNDTCFVLTSANRLSSTSPQIIDAAELSFRENAELTKYCTLLVGCSSGVTWLATSDWAKKLPMIQLLNPLLQIYAGVHYDFQINNLDNSRIIEMVDFDKTRVRDCIRLTIENGIDNAKARFHQSYKPGYFDLKNNTRGLLAGKHRLKEIVESVRNFVKLNSEFGNPISVFRYWYLLVYTYIYGFFYRNIQATESGFFFFVRKCLK